MKQGHSLLIFKFQHVESIHEPLWGYRVFKVVQHFLSCLKLLPGVDLFKSILYILILFWVLVGFAPLLIKYVHYYRKLTQVLRVNTLLDVLIHFFDGVLNEVLLESRYLKEVVAVLHAVHDVGGLIKHAFH